MGLLTDQKIAGEVLILVLDEKKGAGNCFLVMTVFAYAKMTAT